MELLSGRGEVRSGRGGVRSGRAVVGVDVVSQTLPRNYRAPSQHHCCPPGPRPSVRCDMSSDSRCAGCMSDSSLEDQTRPRPPLPPYPPHRYHREEWVDPEVDCATCRLQAQPPCACSDPCYLGGPPSIRTPCPWGRPGIMPSQTSHLGLIPCPPQPPAAGRASSVCALPKLLSIEERLTTALGRPLDPQSRSQPHVDTHAHIHAHSSQTYTHSTTQAHVHAKCETTPNTHAQHQHLNPNNSYHHHHHHKGQSATDPHSLGVHRDGGTGSRLSRSMENLPRDIQDHILRCQCSCDHLGYGNYSATSLQQVGNGCSSISNKSSSREHVPPESGKPKQHQHAGGGLEVPAQVWGGVCLVLVLAGVAGVGVSVPLALRANPGADVHERLNTARALLRETPLVDGHNDLPWNIRKFMHNKLHSFNFTAELKKLRPWSRSSWSHTDLPRLRDGMVGAQFWVSYVPCESQRLNAVQLTIEQIDLIKRLIEQYPEDLRLATSADEVEAAFKEGRIASLIGVEGGHAIQNSLGVLRALRDLGVRYLTLTHTCSTPWAECARARETDLEDPDSPRGLTHFGRTVVREMNRLGLLVDLSHVSQATMREALKVSRAPVIFSHSSVYAICKNPRNVPDDILREVAVNGGVVMVSFYTHFLTCSQQASVKDVVDHINHVRKVAGVEHVGIGADFDGVNKLPEGLEDVSRYPHLFAELLTDPTWSLEDLKLLAGKNLLRVMRNVEKVHLDMKRKKEMPYEEEVPPDQLEGLTSCSYRFTKDDES